MAILGHLYVIAAPSGTGKTTLVEALVAALPNVMVSISHTTRPKRPHEKQGVNYHFVDQATFKRMIEQSDFLEYATVFEHFYGTSKQEVQRALTQGMDVILEIDWQGQQQIRRLFPEMISIFVLPPSFSALKERLIVRNQDQPGTLLKRLADASQAVSHIDEFQYVVVNDEFAQAVRDLKMIVEVGRLCGEDQRAKYALLITELLTSST